MSKAAAHWRALSRTSLTPKGTSLAAELAPVVCNADVEFGVHISELEVDESAAASGADAEVKQHGDRQAHADE